MHAEEKCIPLQEYEVSKRLIRRNQNLHFSDQTHRFILTRQERERLLIDWGADVQDIVESIRVNARIKHQRRRTVNNRYDRWEEVMEKASRKLKKTWRGKQQGHGSTATTNHNVFDSHFTTPASLAPRPVQRSGSHSESGGTPTARAAATSNSSNINNHLSTPDANRVAKHLQQEDTEDVSRTNGAMHDSASSFITAATSASPYEYREYEREDTNSCTLYELEFSETGDASEGCWTTDNSVDTMAAYHYQPPTAVSPASSSDEQKQQQQQFEQFNSSLNSFGEGYQHDNNDSSGRLFVVYDDDDEDEDAEESDKKHRPPNNSNCSIPVSPNSALSYTNDDTCFEYYDDDNRDAFENLRRDTSFWEVQRNNADGPLLLRRVLLPVTIVEGTTTMDTIPSYPPRRSWD